MKWLIQPTKVEEEKIKELINILEKAGIDYDLVYPFEDKVVKQDKTLYHYDDDEKYFVCGSYSLTKNVYKERKEAVFSLDKYKFDDFITIFGSENFVNHDAKIVNYNKIIWEDDEYFLRPVNDDKSFNGGVYSKNDVINCHEDVIVAKVKKINKEHRFFIVDGKIATASLYKVNGSISTSDVIDEGTIEFAESMIKKFNSPGFVIDIATIGNEYKIVELNCLNASGFYDINLYKLIDSVERYYSK